MAPGIQKFNWFCGDCNYTAESCSNFDNFEWKISYTLHNACFVNLTATVPHLFFILVGSLILFTLSCCCGLRKKKSRFLIKQPGHNIRWIMNFFLFNVTMLQFGEGLITDVDANWDFPTQPFMYVAPTLAFAAAILTIIYYHLSETWRKPWMSGILLIYWLSAIGAEALRFNELYVSDKNEGKDFLDSVVTLRYDLSMASMVLYSLYAILEIYMVRKQS